MPYLDSGLLLVPLPLVKSVLAHVSPPYWLTFLVIVLGGLTIGGFQLLGNGFEIPSVTHQGYHGLLDQPQFIGVLIIQNVMPLAFLAWGAMVYSLASPSLMSSTTRTGMYLGMMVVAVGLNLLSWITLIKPMAIFEAGFGLGVQQADELDGVWGGLIFVATAAMAVVFGFLALRETIERYQGENAGSLQEQIDFLQRSRFLRFLLPGAVEDPLHPLNNLMPLLSLFVVVGMCFLAACSFSSHWNITSAYYFPSQNTFNILPDSISNVNSNFKFKLYTDVAVYYLTIVCLAVLAAVAHFTPFIRRTLHYRFPLIVWPKSWKSDFGFITFGEALVCCVVFWLFAFWIWYWPPFLQWRASSDGQDDEQYFTITIAARTLGHSAVLSMSLMMFPVTRNSMWEAVFGSTFEQTLKFHRILGTLSYLLSTLHMLFWLCKWAREDIFWQNFFAITDIVIANVLNSDNRFNYYHYDNFTIAASEISWIFMTIMVILALTMRRNSYELFYYTHQLAIGVFVTVLVHAWSSWFFLMPPLVFWVLDKAFRMFRTRSTVVSLDFGCGGITRVVAPTVFDSYRAGQYVWLNVPSLSHTEWHPFTISSAPGSANMTFHIKNMGMDKFTGAESFTAGLARIAVQNESLEVLIDGPYGRQPYFAEDYEALVFVAGGIGVTPAVSIFLDFYNRARAHLGGKVDLRSSHENCNLLSFPLSKLKRIVLLWVVKDEAQLAPFAEQLWTVRQNNVLDAFDIFIHVTSSGGTVNANAASFYPDLKPAIVNYVASTAHQGRPDLNVFFNHLNVPASISTLVFACGPEELVNDANNQAYKNGYSFHSEVFHF